MNLIRIKFMSYMLTLWVLFPLVVSACASQQQSITLPEDVDIGLKAVKHAGLIQQLSLPAQATLTAKGALSASVVLDWAYADESRLAMGWTVYDLNMPKDTNLDDYICDPYFAKKEGIEFGKYGMLRYIRPESDSPNSPIHLTYIYYQDVTSEKAREMDFTADLTLGDCGNAHTGLESEQNPAAQTTLIPLIGNYQVSFKLPVYDGISIHPEQTIRANEITARLETVVASPSYLIAKVCFSIDELSQKLGDWEAAGWYTESSLQINDGDWLENNFVYPDLANKEQCTDFGFGTPFLEKENQVIIRVSPSVDGLKENWEFRLQVTKINP